MSSDIGSLAGFAELEEFEEFLSKPSKKTRDTIDWFSNAMGAYYTPIGSGWGFAVLNACLNFTTKDKKFLEKLSAERGDAATEHSTAELLRSFKQFVDGDKTYPGYFQEIVTLADFIQLRSLIKMSPDDCADPWGRFFDD
jgi:hypothetical protein